MKALLQRVADAEVGVDGKAVGSIGEGLLVYVGVGNEDTFSEADLLARKVANCRIFEDSEDKLNLSVKDIGGQVLVIPNFTLMADTKKGRRPAFNPAAAADKAQPLQKRFIDSLKREGCCVETGAFQADMTIVSTACGPVNVIIELP